jgi:SAM-dependent methyltransferase
MRPTGDAEAALARGGATSRSRAYWEGLASGGLLTEAEGPWRAYCDALHERILARWLPHGGFQRILKTDLFDEAVGEGLYGGLSRRGKTVLGIDISHAICMAAKARHGGLAAVTADVRRLPFGDGAFDAIVSNSTLDHFESREEIRAAIGELGRALAGGGTLFITMDNPSNPIVALRNRVSERLLTRTGIIPYKTGVTCALRELVRYLEEAGLSVAKVAAMMHCPRVLAVAAARMLGTGGARTAERYSRALLAFERLEALPTRFLTGYYIAVLATKGERCGKERAAGEGA